MNIVFAPETVDDAQSPAIRGDLTIEQAVTRALAKTKLRARQATNNSILIERWLRLPVKCLKPAEIHTQ